MEQPLGFSLRWLSVSCFELRCGSTAIVTDPYITDCAATDLTWEAIERCDMILLSHGHSDHITDIPALTETFRPLILCGDQTAMPMARWLNYTPTRIYPAYPGVELDFGDVKVMPLFGRHQEQNRGYSDKLALYGPKYPEEMLPEEERILFDLLENGGNAPEQRPCSCHGCGAGERQSGSLHAQPCRGQYLLQ